MFTEKFGRYVCTGASISCEVDGFTVTARIERDDAMGPPWEEHDGHGPVTDWTRRDKGPGERVLIQDGAGERKSCRFYDFAEAVKIARRDGWGPTEEGDTEGQAAARAAERDFAVMKAWCADEWSWCGVVLTVEREGVEVGSASLWGIEANYPGADNSYLGEVANELLPEALENAKATVASLTEAPAPVDPDDAIRAGLCAAYEAWIDREGLDPTAQKHGGSADEFLAPGLTVEQRDALQAFIDLWRAFGMGA